MGRPFVVKGRPFPIGEKMEKTPGQAAYEAYGVVLNGYDAGFRFEGLSEEGKARWERVAQAAIDWYKVHNIVVPHE